MHPGGGQGVGWGGDGGGAVKAGEGGTQDIKRTSKARLGMHLQQCSAVHSSDITDNTLLFSPPPCAVRRKGLEGLILEPLLPAFPCSSYQGQVFKRGGSEGMPHAVFKLSHIFLTRRTHRSQVSFGGGKISANPPS